MSSCYELPLTPNYVRDWDFNMAVRELIQNGLDQQAVDAKSVFSVEYDRTTQKLKFTNQRSRLKVNTLLLGRSSKSDDDETVGQFGEGYKIAALVLNRLGKTFTIYNNMMNQVWTSKFKNSKNGWTSYWLFMWNLYSPQMTAWLSKWGMLHRMRLTGSLRSGSRTQISHASTLDTGTSLPMRNTAGCFM